MVRIVLRIQDMPQHQRGGLLCLRRQQFLAVAEAPPVGHALHRIVAQPIARLESGSLKKAAASTVEPVPYG